MTVEPTHIAYADIERVDVRVGIVAVDDFPAARNPAYKLQIDFGSEIGLKKSSAQTTKHYPKEQLMNRLVVAVVNFPPKQIGPCMSEGVDARCPRQRGRRRLLIPERDVPLGGRTF
jgi:tRNA-binding protein